MPAHRTRDTSSRSLEVTTDVLSAPTLAIDIISPTPRALTFSNVYTTPCSSTSCSPFEPERSLAVSSSPSSSLIPTLIRSLSPSQSIRSSSPSYTHRRRRSSTVTSTSDVERRPKKGDDDYIKRPENAFILFRRKCCEERQAAQEEAAAGIDGPARKQRQADLSKTISQQWKGLTTEERRHWEELAKEKKKEHEKLYPDYVYRPQRAKDKDGRVKARKSSKGAIRDETDQETDSERVSFVLPVASQRHHGRSASAPSPPLPYQSIQLPNVYMPSCPTSPSLMPMIIRRASHPGHQGSVSQFDFCPTNTLMPPSFGQAGQYEASLQSSEFYPGMYMPVHSEQMLPTLQIGGAPVHHSGTSSPVSPNAGPFTPTANMLASSFSRLSSDGYEQNEQQLRAQQELEFHAFSWENNDWPSGSEMFLGDDFDINAIPPIELGLPKIMEDMGAQGAEYEQEFGQVLDESQFQERQSVDGLYNFEDMMAVHGF